MILRNPVEGHGDYETYTKYGTVKVRDGHWHITHEHKRWYPKPRESWRKVPLWMTINRMRGKCWCGRAKRGADRKFCQKHEHSWMWWACIRTIWGWYTQNNRLLEGVKCEKCGAPQSRWSDRTDGHQLDHIVPLVHGGTMWDNWNHQVLCAKCHRIKTGQESTARAELRRGKERAKHKARTLGAGPDLLAYGGTVHE